MVIIVAAFIQARRVILAELLGLVFVCVCLASFVGRGGVYGALGVACLVKSFEWDVLAAKKSGDG